MFFPEMYQVISLRVTNQQPSEAENLLWRHTTIIIYKLILKDGWSDKILDGVVQTDVRALNVVLERPSFWQILGRWYQLKP